MRSTQLLAVLLILSSACAGAKPDRIYPAIVDLKASNYTGPGGFCAGFGYRGYVVTARHCIVDAKRVRIAGYSESYKDTEVLAQGPEDIALVKRQPNSPLMDLERAPSPFEAEEVRSVGHPGRNMFHATYGLYEGKVTTATGSYVRSSARVRRGDSGGALVNPADQVLGVTVIRAEFSDGTVASYAVHISRVDDMIERYEAAVRDFGEELGVKNLPLVIAPPMIIDLDVMPDVDDEDIPFFNPFEN